MQVGGKSKEERERERERRGGGGLVVKENLFYLSLLFV